MKRQRRLIILVLVLVPLVAAGALAAVVALLPTERVAAIAAERAEAVLEREVRIERVSLDLFPRPGVALERVVIGGATPQSAPFATVRRVLLRPRLLPLLSRRIVVDAVVLEHPRVLLDVSSAGALDRRVSEEAAAPAGGADAAFLVQRFEIRDGRIAYRDRKTGNVVRLDGVDQRLRLSGAVVGGRLARIELEGTLEADSVGASLPGALAVPVRGVPLRIEHEALLDLAADSLVLRRLVVGLEGLALEGGGTVHRLTAPEAREVSLRLAAASFDAGALIRSLPQGLLEAANPAGGPPVLPELSGWVSVQIAASGRLGPGAIPEVHGTVTLEQVGLAYAELGELVTGLRGEIGFSLDSVASPKLLGRLAGQPFEVAFTVNDPAAPVVRGSVRAVVDLARLAALGLLPDSVEARGRLGVDVAARVALMEPAGGAVDGTVQLQDVALATPALQHPVTVEGGRLVFQGQQLRGEALRLRAGESDLALDLAVEDWLPFAFGDSTIIPAATFDARSRLLDLDALLGSQDSALYSTLFFARLADRQVDGRPVHEVAEEAGLGLPPLPPVALEGRLRAATLRRNGLELSDVDVAVIGRGDRLELTQASFQLMGGGVRVAGRVGLPTASADGAAYPTALTYEIRDVGAAPFFDSLTPFRDHLGGSLLMAGTASLVLDEHLLPRRESVTAEGTLAVNDGRLANWPVLSALGTKLGLAQLDTLTFRDWTGQFEVTGPRIALTESALVSDELHVRAAGSFDFAGRLDLAATLRLDPALARQVRGELASRLTAAVAGPDGRIPLGLRITGPATAPELQLDLSRAASNAVARARAEAEARARELAEQAVQEAAGRLLPTDSLPAAVDTARAKLEKRLKSQLCRIVKCR